MSQTTTCPRCGGPHRGRDCKASFKDSWKGRWKFNGTVVTPDGSGIELEMALDEHGESLMKQLVAIASGGRKKKAERPA